MKHFIKNIAISTILFMLIIGCDKKDTVAYYNGSIIPVVNASADSVSCRTSDSSKTVLTLRWTDPKNGGIDSATRYVLQIDSSGRNFSQAYTDTLYGTLSKSFTAPQLDSILLYNLGLSIYKTYNIDVRVISSYANNNDMQISKTFTLKASTFFAPAAVVPPASDSLYIVGDATQGGWGNPVPVPSQEFSQIDSLTYVGTFSLNGGGQFLLLPVNGDWSNKYAVASGAAASLKNGGAFGYNFSDNFDGPDSTGNYQIKVDFLRGKFTVTKQ